MAKLKWTIDLKLNDASMVSVPYVMEVEREWSEVVLGHQGQVLLLDIGRQTWWGHQGQVLLLDIGRQTWGHPIIPLSRDHMASDLRN